MAALKKKDEDMKAMEERYKMYLEKARNVRLCVCVYARVCACVYVRPTNTLLP